MGWGRVSGRGWGTLRPGRLGRRTVLGLVVVLLGTVGVGGWLLTRGGDAQAAQTVTATVAAGTFQDTVSATGTLQPTRQADLDFAVSGRVTSVKVAAGDQVEKGDVLARLDRTSLDAALTSARAQLDAAQAQYAEDLESEAATTQLSADSASVAAAQAGLSQATDDLDAATLTATMTGTVATVDLAVGDQVSGTSSGGTSSGGSAAGSGSAGSGSGGSGGSGSATSSSKTSQVVIVSPFHFKVDADVAAEDITAVKEGLQAQVTPSGATTPVFGTVTSVGLVAAASSSGAATFPVTVAITGAQAKLYAGTSATVAIITKQVADVLSVPTLALHTSGSQTYVERLVDGAKVRTKVELGTTYGASTEVTSGVQAGDKVVLTTVRLPTGTGGRTGNQRGGGFGGVPGGGLPGGGVPGGLPGGGTPPDGVPGGGFGGTP